MIIRRTQAERIHRMGQLSESMVILNNEVSLITPLTYQSVGLSEDIEYARGD